MPPRRRPKPTAAARRASVAPASVDELLAQAKARALSLLEVSARSSLELRECLRRKFPSAIVDQVIADFERAGLLNDEALAARLVERELERLPADRPLLEEKLARRGVGTPVVRDAVDQALAGRSSWTDALTAARLKLQSLGPGAAADPHKAARRIIGLLGRRGFEYEVACEAALTALREAGIDIETEA